MQTTIFLQNSMPESFHSPPSFVPVIEKGFENDIDLQSFNFKNKLQGGQLGNNFIKPISNENNKIMNGNGSLARIKVVVCLFLRKKIYSERHC